MKQDEGERLFAALAEVAEPGMTWVQAVTALCEKEIPQNDPPHYKWHAPKSPLTPTEGDKK